MPPAIDPPPEGWTSRPVTKEDKAAFAAGLEADRRFRLAMDKMSRAEASRKRQALRRERQEDMGAGYLIYVARKHSGLRQDVLARRMGTTQSRISHWESGLQLPTLRTLKRVTDAAGLELVVGLKHPDSDDDLIALAVVDDEANATTLRMMLDYDSLAPLPPTRWRERLRETLRYDLRQRR